MASPATTSLTLGSIFDLVGPAAPTAPPDQGQASFDALLQPPPSAPPPPPAPADAPTQQDRALPHAAAGNEPPQPTSLASSTGSHDDSDSSADAAKVPSNATGREADSPPPQDRDATSSREQPTAADEVVAQSLAGLPAVHSAAASSAPPAKTAADNPTDEEPIEPSAGGKQKAPALQIASTAVSKQTTTAISPGDQPPEAEAPVKTKVALAAASGAEERAGISAVGADASHPEKPGDRAGAKSQRRFAQRAMLDDSAEPDNSAPAAGLPLDQPSASQRSLAEAISAELPAAASPPMDGSSQPAAMPVAAASAPQSPMADAPPTTAAPTAANAALSAAPPQRFRLPAELANQIAGASVRRSGVDIDSTRLLTRVARAFTAAQERDGEVRLRLSPPELGALRLEVRVQDGALVAHLHTETDAARAAIVDNLPALRDRLADQGVRIERFDVDLMQRQGGGMPDQSGSRQQDASPPPLRAGPSSPSQTRSVVPAKALPSYPAAGSTDGLNVII